MYGAVLVRKSKLARGKQHRRLWCLSPKSHLSRFLLLAQPHHQPASTAIHIMSLPHSQSKCCASRTIQLSLLPPLAGLALSHTPSQMDFYRSLRLPHMQLPQLVANSFNILHTFEHVTTTKQELPQPHPSARSGLRSLGNSNSVLNSSSRPCAPHSYV